MKVKLLLEDSRGKFLRFRLRLLRSSFLLAFLGCYIHAHTMPLLTRHDEELPKSRQTAEVRGTVLDQEDKPLVGASVFIKGTKSGTSTAVDGTFVLKVSADSTELEISLVGYRKQSVTASKGARLQVKLQAAEEVMEEVVVVGYGSQRKKDLTGSLTSINASSLEKIPATNIAQRLAGKVAGMSVSVATRPGGGDENIRIRGEKSLSGNNGPLIVLDGIPFNGTLNQIDQNSVENISVLKDASAAAIYGSRAANGVIIVTTKSGKEGQTNISYNGYVSLQTPQRLFNIQNGTENLTLLKEFYRDMGYDESFWSDPTQILPSLPLENYLKGEEFDWQDELFNNALQQEHQLSLSGASGQSRYYASFAYTDQNGLVKNSDFTKFATTLNLSHRFSDWLTVGTNNQFNQRANHGVMPRIDQAFYLSPWSKPYDENGGIARYPMYSTTYWVNPYVDADGVEDNINRNVFTSWNVDVKLPIEGLTFRSNFGYNYRTAEFGSYYGKTTLTGMAVEGIANIKNTHYYDWTWENVVKYDRNFGRHHFDLTGLVSSQKTRDMYSTMTGRNFLNDNNAYFNIDAAQGEKTITSDKTETSLASYMGRLNYNFDSRYLLTLTGRYDGYSAFGVNNKWAFFPSVALGWVLSEEAFFSGAKRALEYLKIRASYGSNGNQGVAAYQTLTQLSQLDYIYGDGSSFAGGLNNPLEVGNPNLRWETTNTLNLGLDFSALNSRLNGNLEVYASNTKDLLMKRTVPIMNGYKSMMDNIGKTTTRGFELTLNTANIKRNDFSWETDIVFSGNWNKIKALREDGADDLGNAWFIGQPVRVFYDYNMVGVWQTDEAEEAAKYGAVPGDARLEDTNGNGTIDASDRVIIGSKLPVWLAGLKNTFTYKNFSFSFFLNGVFDLTKENLSLNFSSRQFDKGTNFLNDIAYWTPENGSTEATRLGYNPKNAHKFYSDASFVRIQDVTLGYRLTDKLASHLGLASLGIYANISNLYTFSKINKYGINPEQSIIGAPSSYPVPRAYTLGVNLTF